MTDVQQPGHKLYFLKIATTTALRGFGGEQIKDIITLYQASYLAPLVAFFLTSLPWGSAFLIREKLL